MLKADKKRLKKAKSTGPKTLERQSGGKALGYEVAGEDPAGRKVRIAAWFPDTATIHVTEFGKPDPSPTLGEILSSVRR